MKKEHLTSVNPTIYFDGVCNLCNRFVSIIVHRDTHAIYKFAPLQGETAKTRLPADLRESCSTIVLEDQDGLSFESDAVIKILQQLKYLRLLATSMKIFPVGFRNIIYRFISRNRLSIFGSKETCRVPTAAEANRFLP